MSSTAQAPDLLAAIIAGTERIVARRVAEVPLAEMERRAAAAEPRPGMFKSALARGARLNVIAECKRRSPSRGVLKHDYDPAAIARGYEKAGAAAISVLTEPTFFDGELSHLADVRAACGLPILRKDFIVDRYQILEACAAGADAILLIAATLTAAALKQLHDSAVRAGMDVLVEIHGLEELPMALDAGASIVGVNNRNLRTLAVEADLSERAIATIPDDVVAVAESGFKTGEDLRRLRTAGYDACLIGEGLMITADPGRTLAALLKEAGV
jgi:indole-3-glycerol phosphate synthase